MKTTIEINDELLRQAKIRAAERGETLRELVERGLRRELDEAAHVPSEFVLRDASVGDPNAPPPELDWDEIREEATRWRMWGK